MLQTLSERGLLLLQASEGYRSAAYQDGAGIWTIGYGTTRVNGQPVRPGMTCTHAQALAWLRADAEDAMTAVRALDLVLTANEFDALVSLVYNIGGGNFRKSSLRSALLHHEPVFEDLFTRWSRVTDPGTGAKVVSPGLMARRKREYSLFMETAE